MNKNFEVVKTEIRNLKPKPQRRRKKTKLSRVTLKGVLGAERNALVDLRNDCYNCDESAKGWYLKYIDPAGSVETHRAIGEFSKIPDGMCPFSVDAEIRTITNLSCPSVDNSDLPLDGKTWSLHILSYPLFRIGFIAVASVNNLAMSLTVQQALIQDINNLSNPRDIIDRDVWIPVTGQDSWFWKVSPLPPTYDLPDEVSSITRSVSAWRMSYKSLTCELNAPTLIDQGFWIGGQYALDPKSVSLDATGGPVGTQPTWFQFRNHAPTPTATNANVLNVSLPFIPVIGLDGTVVQQNDDLDYFNCLIEQPASVTSRCSFVVPSEVTLYDVDTVWASPGDTVTIELTYINPNWISELSSSRTGTNLLTTATLFRQYVSMNDLIYATLLETQIFPEQAAALVPFPALTMQEIAANNPKVEQALMKDTKGAYLVHSKFRQPVFSLTPAASYGPLQFTCPGYDLKLNHNDGSGILDSMDQNFSTVVFVAQQLSQAASVVVKLYQGWEGVTNVNTPFGQFGHTGLERDDTILTLADNVKTKTTGIYPGSYNFLGSLAVMAYNALKGVLLGQLTPPLLKNVVERLLGKLESKVPVV